jgi:MFS family permease
VRGVLADRDIRPAIAGQVFSTLGTQALFLALGIWTKILTGSSSAAGLVFFMVIAGTLCAPLGGIVVDRCRRRSVLMLLNPLGAVLVLPLLLAHGRGAVLLIYTVMFGYGVLAGVIGGAQTALTQAIVPTELLGEVNGLLQTLLEGVRLLSPLLGAGALAAFGLAPVVLGDAATFLVAAVLVYAVTLREEPPKPSGEGLWTQISAGARYITADVVLRRLTAAIAVAIVAFGLSETVTFSVVAQGLHRPASFMGVLNAVQGAGAVAGGVVAARLLRRVGEQALVALGLSACGVAFLAMAVPSLPVVCAGIALGGAGIPWVLVALMTAVQRRTPPPLMGRVDTAMGMMISAPQTAAIAAGAGLLAFVDFRVLLVAMTVVLFASAVFVRLPGAVAAPAET